MSNQTPEKVRHTSFDAHAYDTALATINDLRKQLTQSEANQAVMREAVEALLGFTRYKHFPTIGSPEFVELTALIDRLDTVYHAQIARDALKEDGK